MHSVGRWRRVFAHVTRRPYCPGWPKKLCFTTPSNKTWIKTWLKFCLSTIVDKTLWENRMKYYKFIFFRLFRNCANMIHSELCKNGVRNKRKKRNFCRYVFTFNIGFEIGWFYIVDRKGKKGTNLTNFKLYQFNSNFIHSAQWKGRIPEVIAVEGIRPQQDVIDWEQESLLSRFW